MIEKAAVKTRDHFSFRAKKAQDFTAFYEEQVERLTIALVVLVRDAALAEEIAQEAFSRVWTRWEKVSKMDSPDGYLFRIALNIFRDSERSRRRGAAEVLPEANDPLQAVEGRTALEHALLSLPVRQRTAIVITEFLGFDSREAGRMMGVRPGTVRALNSSARAALSNLLSDERGS
jgi:RNA polymerase sigma factor (sigma-70 family)